MNRELLEKINLIRNETGVGMSDAIKYLKEFKDPKIAIEELLKKGFKKLDENIQERVIDISLSNDYKICSLLILGCRTDFVSATNAFKETHKKLSLELLNNNVDESVLDLLSQKTGERISIVERKVFSTEIYFSYYVHHDRKKASIVEFTEINSEEKIKLEEITVNAILYNTEDLNILSKSSNLLGSSKLDYLITSLGVKKLYNIILSTENK